MRPALYLESRKLDGAAGRSGFTLLEIAVSLGVIAFALVAVLGTLPNGMNAQRDNLEKSIINEDAQLLIEAIREGNETLFSLTNHVEAITRYGTNAGAPLSYITSTIVPNNNVSAALVGEELGSGAAYPPGSMVAPLGTNNAAMIMALLTTPRGTPMTAKGNEYLYKTVALVRSFSGGMLQQATALTNDLSFRYLLTVEVSPFSGFYAPLDVERLGTETLGAVLQASNRLQQVIVVSNNVHELRLTFQWPVLAGRPGSNRQTYRTLVSGIPQQVVYPSTPLATEQGQLYRFQSQVYQAQPNPPIR